MTLTSSSTVAARHDAADRCASSLELAVGQVVSLGRPLAGPFEVRAAGRVVGQGELVDVDGELGVRIVSLGIVASSYRNARLRVPVQSLRPRVRVPAAHDRPPRRRVRGVRQGSARADRSRAPRSSSRAAAGTRTSTRRASRSRKSSETQGRRGKPTRGRQRGDVERRRRSARRARLVEQRQRRQRRGGSSGGSASGGSSSGGSSERRHRRRQRREGRGERLVIGAADRRQGDRREAARRGRGRRGRAARARHRADARGRARRRRSGVGGLRRSKTKAAREAGVEPRDHKLPATTTAGRADGARRARSTPIRASTASSSRCRCRRTSTPTR